MEKGDTPNTGRLTDWIILIFVLVVMGLLIADLGSNVGHTLERNRKVPAENTATPTTAD